MSLQFAFALLLVIGTVAVQSVLGINDEARLIRRLKFEYPEKHARPLVNSSEAINVGVEVLLFRINEFDIERAALSLNVWMRYGWQDEYLKWDPALFGGLKSINLPIEDIWSHDIALYNKGFTSRGYGGLILEPKSMATITYTGYVVWVPTGQLNALVNTTAKRDGEFDCELKLGSWGNSKDTLDINFISPNPGLDLTYYSEHPKFKLVSNTAVKINKKYPCCKETYPLLSFKLTLKKQKGKRGRH